MFYIQARMPVKRIVKSYLKASGMQKSFFFKAFAAWIKKIKG